ncbi:MAG: helix-turn-helix domain-containing protein [Actinomycetota bacterium]
MEGACPGRARTGRSRSLGLELTSTERRVAAAVTEGMKNKEIAQAMFVSVATVEAHLTRIYRKLGVRSRGELIRLVSDGSLELGADLEGP